MFDKLDCQIGRIYQMSSNCGKMWPIHCRVARKIALTLHPQPGRPPSCRRGPPASEFPAGTASAACRCLRWETRGTQPNSSQTLDGSFSAVSKPIFATKQPFESIFRDLQDLQSFAPLRSQNFNKTSSNFSVCLLNFPTKVADFLQLFVLKC